MAQISCVLCLKTYFGLNYFIVKGHLIFFLAIGFSYLHNFDNPPKKMYILAIMSLYGVTFIWTLKSCIALRNLVYFICTKFIPSRNYWHPA